MVGWCRRVGGRRAPSRRGFQWPRVRASWFALGLLLPGLGGVASEAEWLQVLGLVSCGPSVCLPEVGEGGDVVYLLCGLSALGTWLALEARARLPEFGVAVGAGPWVACLVGCEFAAAVSCASSVCAVGGVAAAWSSAESDRHGWRLWCGAEGPAPETSP